MDERPNKPLGPIWLAMAVMALPVLYVASFGPACRLFQHQVLTERQITIVYKPCIAVACDGPAWARRPLQEWADLCGGEIGLTIIHIHRLPPAHFGPVIPAK